MAKEPTAREQREAAEQVRAEQRQAAADAETEAADRDPVAYNTAGQTGPPPRVAVVDVEQRRRGGGEGIVTAPAHGSDVFVQRGDHDLVLVRADDAMPAELAAYPTVPAELDTDTGTYVPSKVEGKRTAKS